MKQTYSQDWIAYDKAKTREVIYFKTLLFELLDIYFKKSTTNGKRVSNKDRLFMMALKTYYNMDFRKCKGLIEENTGRDISYKSLCNFFNDEALEPMIDDLILITALPLSELEITGAIDSTGFSTSCFEKWNDYKWGSGRKSGLQKKGKERVWRKAHAVAGCHTNTIISIKVTSQNVHDINLVEPLLKDTKKYFNLQDFTADKAYSSRKVLEFLKDLELTPFIPFKKNVTGKSIGSMYWSKMFKFFKNNQEEFNRRYHKRSNVETCFHMIKKRFGNNVRTKGLISNINEIKLKFLCHNICVLIQELFESDIEIDFKSCVNTITSV